MEPIRPEWHNENRIEDAIRHWLEKHGWLVHTRLGSAGADVSAIDPRGTPWFFEIKGYPATYFKRDGTTKSKGTIWAQRRTWFVTAMGQIVTRMRYDDGRYYALVFPAHPTDTYFEQRALELPSFLRKKLNLWVLLVSENGVLSALAPQHDKFEEWSHAVSREA